MAFITEANSRRIIQKTKVSEINLKGQIYDRSIYFLSSFEMQQLLAYKQLMEDPDTFVRKTYKPIDLKKDSYAYVYEYDQEKPAFHKNLGCQHLKKDYENFTIPDEIRFKENGQLNFKKIHEFRRWFPTVQHLFKSNKEAFTFRLEMKFGIKTNPLALESPNTGPVELVNYNIQELKEKINKAIKEAGRYYYASPKNTKILRQFSKYSFLGFRNDTIHNNETGYSDREVKEFLREYHVRIKKPIKVLLREYYRLEFNPDFKFNQELLLYLNFKPCSNCYDNSYSSEAIDPQKGQFKVHEDCISKGSEQEFFEDYMKFYEKLPTEN